MLRSVYPRLHILSITVLVFLMTISINIDTYAQQTDMPMNIRVGLHFSDTSAVNLSRSVQKINFKVEGSIEVGMGNELEYQKIFTTESTSSFDVEKDQLAYHIQIGQKAVDYENAMIRSALYNQLGIMSFPAYNDGWFIYLGEYGSVDDLQPDIKKLSTDIDQSELSIIQTLNKSIVLRNPSDSLITFLFSSSDDKYIRLAPDIDTDPEIFYLDNVPYRGSLEIRRYEKSDMTIINIVNIQHYLYGVVPAEIGHQSPPEALKAQTVAARTYLMGNMGRYSHIGIDVCDSVYSQVYKGYSYEKPSTNLAVDQTDNECIYFDGKPASIHYFSTSGGMTESSFNVWSAVYPYLISVEDSYEDSSSPYSSWEKKYSFDEMTDLLKTKGYDLGRITNIEIIKISEAGRPIEIKIHGDKSSKSFYKSECRNIFNLPSQWYTVTSGAKAFVYNKEDFNSVAVNLAGRSIASFDGISDLNTEKVYVLGGGNNLRSISFETDGFVFNGRGYGHGVGMSQQGAKGMALAGFDYKQILLHYYTGVTVE